MGLRNISTHGQNAHKEINFRGKKPLPMVRKKSGIETTVGAHQKQSEKTNDDIRGKERKRYAFNAQLYLYPGFRTRGKSQCFRNCDASDNETKTAFLEEYRSSKKAQLENKRKGNGRKGRIAYTPSSQHLFVFRASFMKGAIEINMMADRGTDVYFMYSKMWNQVHEKTFDLPTTGLDPPLLYRGVTGDPCLTCERSVKIDVFLQTKHGSSFILKIISWKVTKEGLPTPIIGGRVLESLGCDNKEMLMAARDNYGDNIDVADRLAGVGNEEESEGRIAAFFGKCIFHNGGHAEDDDLEDGDVYVDLGDDR